MISRIRIGHMLVDVRLDELEEDRIGEYRYRSGEIRISGGLKPDIQAVTLLHEIFHAFMADRGRNAGMTEEQEEEEVTFWASAVSTLIADNPSLAVYLLRAYGDRDSA